VTFVAATDCAVVLWEWPMDLNAINGERPPSLAIDPRSPLPPTAITSALQSDRTDVVGPDRHPICMGRFNEIPDSGSVRGEPIGSPVFERPAVNGRGRGGAAQRDTR